MTKSYARLKSSKLWQTYLDILNLHRIRKEHL
nr:MAG TPA: hypothetical protein [Caudoviricetes sp.]